MMGNEEQIITKEATDMDDNDFGFTTQAFRRLAQARLEIERDALPLHAAYQAARQHILGPTENPDFDRVAPAGFERDFDAWRAKLGRAHDTGDMAGAGALIVEAAAWPKDFVARTASGRDYAEQKQYQATIARFRAEAGSTNARCVLDEVEAAGVRLSLDAGKVMATPQGLLSLRLKTLVAHFAGELGGLLEARARSEEIA